MHLLIYTNALLFKTASHVQLGTEGSRALFVALLSMCVGKTHDLSDFASSFSKLAVQLRCTLESLPQNGAIGAKNNTVHF